MATNDDDRKKLSGIAHDVGTMIGNAIREKHPNAGFALLVFDFGDKGSLAWVSNAERADMYEGLVEFLEKNVEVARGMGLERRLAIGERVAKLSHEIGKYRP